jgi:hypothetical protein
MSLTEKAIWPPHDDDHPSLIEFIETDDITENNSLPQPCYKFPVRKILFDPSIIITKLDETSYELTVIIYFEKGDNDHRIVIKFDFPSLRNKQPVWKGEGNPPPPKLLRDFRGSSNAGFAFVTSNYTESFQFIVKHDDLDKPKLVLWKDGIVVITFTLDPNY